KLNRDGIYLFEESKAYDEKRASFAWGMWNDPGLNKRGISTKRIAEAIKGYKRYLDLDDAAGRPMGSTGKPKDHGWYGLPGNTSIRTFSIERLKNLGEF